MEWLLRSIGGLIGLGFLVVGAGYLFGPYQVDGIKGFPPVVGKVDCYGGLFAVVGGVDSSMMPEECKDKGRSRATRGLAYAALGGLLVWLAYNEEPVPNTTAMRREQRPGAVPPPDDPQQPSPTETPVPEPAGVTATGPTEAAVSEPQLPRMKSQMLNDIIAWLSRNKVPLPVKNLTDWFGVLTLVIAAFEYVT